MCLMDPRDLYGLPLERFTEERNTQAKMLRRERRRDEAAEVTKLRKPSVAAWAVNQLVRTQRREMEVLFDAGDALQKAQADLVAGQADPGTLRKAVDAERAAVDELTEKARGLLSIEGDELKASTLKRVSETLHAAALDKDARARVQDGCLHRELRHVGLGPVAASTASRAAAAGGQTGASARTATARKGDQDRATPTRSDRLKAARKVETEARRQIEHADRDLKAAEQRRNRAAENLRQAEDTLADAREAANQKALEHRRAQSALDEL
jgi:hypothetical protein